LSRRLIFTEEQVHFEYYSITYTAAKPGTSLSKTNTTRTASALKRDAALTAARLTSFLEVLESLYGILFSGSKNIHVEP
jgi:hypothetical protein